MPTTVNIIFEGPDRPYLEDTTGDVIVTLDTDTGADTWDIGSAQNAFSVFRISDSGSSGCTGITSDDATHWRLQIPNGIDDLGNQECYLEVDTDTFPILTEGENFSLASASDVLIDTDFVVPTIVTHEVNSSGVALLTFSEDVAQDSLDPVLKVNGTNVGTGGSLTTPQTWTYTHSRPRIYSTDTVRMSTTAGAFVDLSHNANETGPLAELTVTNNSPFGTIAFVSSSSNVAGTLITVTVNHALPAISASAASKHLTVSGLTLGTVTAINGASTFTIAVTGSPMTGGSSYTLVYAGEVPGDLQGQNPALFLVNSSVSVTNNVPPPVVSSSRPKRSPASLMRLGRNKSGI
jgi:hypothetical protein